MKEKRKKDSLPDHVLHAGEGGGFFTIPQLADKGREKGGQFGFFIDS